MVQTAVYALLVSQRPKPSWVIERKRAAPVVSARTACLLASGYYRDDVNGDVYEELCA